jgi:hypothetical protein
MDMKKVLTPLVLAALVFTGCNQTTTTTGKKDGKELKLTTPKSVAVEQGETVKVKVAIDRKGFDDEVTVKFEKLPEGVSIEEADGKLAKGVKEREFTLKATSAAKVGAATAKVSASGGGVENGHDLSVEVKEKKEKPDTKAAELKKKRDELNTAVQAKIRDIDASMTELQAAAKAADAKAKVEIDKHIANLDEQRKKLGARVAEIQAHSGDAWDTFSASVHSAADELHKGVTDAVKKFKKK